MGMGREGEGNAGAEVVGGEAKLMVGGERGTRGVSATAAL